MKGTKYPAEAVTADEVKAMIQVVGRGRTAVRNRALLVLLYRGGLRVSEALDLGPRDIQDGVVFVRRGKGDKARRVALDAGSAAIVQLWMDRRPAGDYLLCTLKGARLGTPYVRRLLPRLARCAGIQRRVNPHSLRHGYAVALLREGVRLDMISAALGHSSIATTAVYLKHLDPAELIDTLKARTW